jgi:hypothetical protein
MWKYYLQVLIQSNELMLIKTMILGHSRILQMSTHTLTHTTLTLTHTAANLFIIYPDCRVTFTPTYIHILYYLNYLVPLHIDSVLVHFVYSLVIVYIVLPFPSENICLTF